MALPKQPAPLDGFLLKGKLAVEAAGERHTANFQWRQDGDVFGIDVWGPLGQGRIHLQGDARRMLLLDGQGEVIEQGQPEELMRSALGWSMPLDVLTSWVLGVPDPQLPTTTRIYGEEGRLASFRQAGWFIQLEQYHEIAEAAGARWLPRKIDATRSDTRIRLIIASWQI